jgi:hypothetical protein
MAAGIAALARRFGLESGAPAEAVARAHTAR